VAAVVFTRESKAKNEQPAEASVIEGSTLERAIPGLARRCRGGLAAAFFSGFVRGAGTSSSR
jgi:hypothetical protein